MEKQIAQMRVDFDRLAARRIAAGHWSEEDACETSREIKAAIEAGDQALVDLWAAWLAAPDAAPAAPVAGADHVRGVTKMVEARPMQTPARGCRTCQHSFRPGLVELPGLCGGRTDLPPAYGEGHPLRQLPADKGATCSTWEAR